MADTPDPKRIKADFSAAAPDYDANAELQRLIRAEAMDMAANLWPPGSHILDVGCGTGSFAAESRAAGLDWHITGVDIAPGMAKAASRHLFAAAADVTALPFLDDSFHGLFSSLMLQWSPQPQAALREMLRVLRPGGHAIVSTFTEGTLDELRNSFAVLGDAPYVMPFLSPMDISAYAAHAGFALVAADEEEFTERYTTFASLLHAIKIIGAGNKQQQRSRGLMTPRQLAKVEAHYHETYGDGESIPATWQAFTVVLEKP